MDINKLVLLAYEDLQKSIKQEKDKSNFNVVGLEHIISFHDKIERWQENEPIDFIWDFIVGNGADCVSGQGMAKVAQPNLRIFINDPITQKKLKQLFMIRKESNLNHTALNKLDEVGLHEHLERFHFESGAKPILYVNRLMVLIFIDIMTTISNTTDLRKIANKLNIKAKGFTRIQYQVKDKINDVLKELDIEPKTVFEKATIAWHILRVDN
ncbi:hypothetical protein [Metabacillus bambusae]|uniref:SAM-dependent methyltransferase n=1 Tax=Metabacillus bambusae TaxID=2795218 RepID=A0ABS3MYQ2_9BACI|nr:hypothetical protein [Metabacillus bambusae]MBO1511131.1 hypothetical protein [Metabacillus bambusae]